jgi:SdrD B-like domain
VKRKLVLVIVALASGLLGARFAFADEPPPTTTKPVLTIGISSSQTTVQAGDTWIYSITYACKSLAEECQRTKMTIPVASGVEVVTAPKVAATGGARVSPNLAVGPGDFTVAFNESVDGNSAVVQLTLRVPTCVQAPKPKPTSGSITVKISADNAAMVSSESDIINIGNVPDCSKAPDCGGVDCLPDPAAFHYKSGSPAAPGTATTWTIFPAQRTYAYEVIDVFNPELVVGDIWTNDTNVEMFVRCGTSDQWLPIGSQLPTNTPAECLVGATQVVRREYPAVRELKIVVEAFAKPRIGVQQYLPERWKNGDALVEGELVKNCAVAYELGEDRPFCGQAKVLVQKPMLTPRIYPVANPEWPLSPRPGGYPGLIPDSESANPFTNRDMAYWAVVNLNRAGGRDLVDPVIVVDLTPNQTFVETAAGPVAANWQHPFAGSGEPACGKPSFAKVNTDTGRERLVWTFKGCTMSSSLPWDPQLGVFFSTRIRPTARAGESIDAMMWASAFDTGKPTALSEQACQELRLVIDVNDMDQDRRTDDAVCFGSADIFPMPSFGELTAKNSVRGEADNKDPAFLGYVYPASGNTDDKSSAATYSIDIKNSGTIGMKGVDFVSILPWLNDRIISPSESSEWDMKLADAGTVERVDADGVASLVPPEDFEIGYSLSRNPCRMSSTPNARGVLSGGLVVAGAPHFPVDSSVTLPTGCDQNPWMANAREAQSVAMQFAPRSGFLLPGETLRVTLRVLRDGPLPVKKNAVAWTSVAFSGVTETGVRLLASSPRVGGVRIVDSPSATGVAWNDANSDGLRGDKEALLAGVEVKAIDTLTNTAVPGTFTTDGRGVYFIPGLIPGRSYTLRFGPVGLVGFEPTLFEAGTDVTTRLRQSYVKKNGTDFEVTSPPAVAGVVSGGLDAGFIPAATAMFGAT